MPAAPRHGVSAPLVVDPLLITTTVLLVGFSLVMVYSTTGVASAEKLNDTFYYVKRQGLAALLGALFMLLCLRVDAVWLKRISPCFYPLGLLLLALVLVPGLGASGGGAQRWISLGIFRAQPGEFAKVLFIIFIAGFYSRHEGSLGGLRDGILKPLLLLSPVAALFLLQPDFGSAAVLALVTLAMGAATGVRLRYLLIGAAGIGAALALLVVVSPYRMMRILSFLSPWSDSAGRGYQLIQSLIAVGTGQVTGVGLGQSHQKLFFLPAAHTDFIFAVISEELGFIGALVLLGLFLVFLWRGAILSARVAEDAFSFALAVGLLLLVVAPALLNIGVVLGLLPTKGLVLPLVGYGGSALIAAMMVVGLLLGIGRSFERR